MRRNRHHDHAHREDDPRYRDPGIAPVFDRPVDATSDPAPRADDPPGGTTHHAGAHHEPPRGRRRRHRQPADPPSTSGQ